MEGAESVPQKRERFPQMSIQRGNKDHYIKVKLYPTPDIDDPRPFIVKDSKGIEVKLELDEQVMGEILYFGKPTAETLERLRIRNLKNNRAKR